MATSSTSAIQTNRSSIFEPTVFSLPLPHPLCSALIYLIHYVQPTNTPSTVFNLQLLYLLCSSFNYHIHYVQTTITPHYIQPTMTPSIMCSLHLPHSLCSAYNYPIHYVSLQLPHSLCSAYNYPIYGTQWHPEKNAFFWNPRFVINHSKRAVKAAEYFARFFVNEGEFCFREREGERERELRVWVRRCVRECVRGCGFM